MQSKFRNAISQWKRQATTCSVLMSDSDSVKMLRQARSKLDECLVNLAPLLEQLLLFEEADKVGILAKFESLESDHVTFMTRLS